MNLSKIVMWTAGVALVLTTTVLAAQGFGPMMGGGRGPGMPAQCGPMARVLNVTEAQQVAMKTITERHQASLEAKQKVAHEAQEDMRKAMHDPAVSEAKVKELHTKVSDAMLAVMLERRGMMQELDAVLTPDQKAAMDKQRTQCGPGPGRGQGKGMGMGMGQGCGVGGSF